MLLKIRVQLEQYYEQLILYLNKSKVGNKIIFYFLSNQSDMFYDFRIYFNILHFLNKRKLRVKGEGKKRR
jgi:hypothetical protein